jgi:hypothetical protein
MDYMDYMDESTIYYDDQPVLYIEEKIDGNMFKTDMRVFIVFDRDENVFCLYGSRKCDKRDKYINYMLKYSNISDLYNYLFVAMNIKFNNVNVTMFYLSELTSNDTFDDFEQKTSKLNELFGYDNIKLKNSIFNKYINVLNTGSNVV